MSAKFFINTSGIYPCLEDLKTISKDIDNLKSRTVTVQKDMQNMESLSVCSGVLQKLVTKMESESNAIGSIESALHEIVMLYEDTEKRLINHNTGQNVNAPQKDQNISGHKYRKDGSLYAKIMELIGWGEPFTEYEIDSIVYDDKGSYGADQGSPQRERGFFSEKKDLYEIVRKYYPDMTDKEIKDYLEKLNSEGCGYVALINTIFAEYEGREKEFEKTFGFPMYYKGDLNYDKLLVDFYASTDNHNPDKYENDVLNVNEDRSSVEGVGTSYDSRAYRLQKYLDEKGAGITYNRKAYNSDTITTENFMEYAKDGYVMISYYHGNIQYENGQTAQYIEGGHGMIVTGVTSDGRFIVSSWGEKYYIDPKEIVTQKGDNGEEQTTRFYFEVINYN